MIYGSITNILPRRFAPPEAWPEYGAIADPISICKRESVGNDPVGIRWSLGPLCFEEYVSDDEPDLKKSKEGSLTRNRIITWKRISRKDVPPGWHELSTKPWRIDGFHSLEKDADYTRRWFKNARREARLWRQNFLDTHYSVELVSLDEFVYSYKKSSTRRKTGLDQLQALVRKYALPEAREHIELWAVRNKRSREIIAGTATITSLDRSSSVRYCPFMLPEARHNYASTGLIDHWFAQSQKEGVSTLLFTCFWQKGDPVGWKGPAEFKSHFGLEYVAYPPALYRFAPGKLF